IIGSLTRSVPAKDLPMMLAAFAQFTAVEGAHLVLAGEGVDQHNVGLQAQIVDLGLQHRVHTLGIRQDSQRLIRAFDFATLSSRSEALPLFLVEAMALGIPCVATRVGDIPAVVANYGVLVAAGASEDLAAAWTKVLSWTAAEKHSKVQAAWEHIQANFSLEKMQLQHLAVIHAVLAADESSQASLAEQAVS
ncbi:MAG TPA: glycosyltransferase, partial [Thiolinea sp.]|nr:glycosyltransferase [Thiolinea sp.]